MDKLRVISKIETTNLKKQTYKNIKGHVKHIPEFAESKKCAEQGLPLTSESGSPAKTRRVNSSLEIFNMCLTPFSFVVNRCLEII